MEHDEIFLSASRAIVDAKRLIEKADAALQQALQFEREYGLSKESINEYMSRNLNETERRQVDLLVQKMLQEIYDATEQAISEKKRNFSTQRLHRIRIHI